MGKLLYLGMLYLLLIASLGATQAADGFEENDQDMDFFSAGKNSNFDLRHTIPGEPGVDYPIYHEVPVTNFLCAGRHEGYYADMESRCQAFHICTHTARSQHGFGFLCPNGTLFSQKNFVCDWYRNVNCDESERYYSKNDLNRIGSNRDMMEAVRQMIEYPMRTITKALQNNGANTKRPTPGKQTLKKALNEAVIPVNSATQSLPTQRKPVTRAEIEQAYDYGNENIAQATPLLSTNNTPMQLQPEITAITAAPQLDSVRMADVEGASKYSLNTGNNELSLDGSGEEVYVNSLGELSTDPGVEFNRTNAHVIAEYPRKYHLDKQSNFASKINAGLNNAADVPSLDVLAPDYIKRIRMTKEEAMQQDLISNINGLLDEVSSDLDPKQSGYQLNNPSKSRQTFRFLSRGFESSERIRKTAPYVYKRPQQTPTTISFTPITTTPIPSETYTDTLAIHITDTTSDDETFQAINTLAELNSDIDNDIGDVFEPPRFEALTQTTTESTDLALNTLLSEPLNHAAADTAGETVNDENPTNDLSFANEEKLDVNKHAESLLVAGVQLSELTNKTDTIEQVKENTTEQPAIAYVHVGSDADVDALILQLVQETVNVTSKPIPRSIDTSQSTTTTTTTEQPNATIDTSSLRTTEEPTTTATTPTTMRTSTETITEVNSTQERLRGFRRYNSYQRGNTNNRTSNVAYGKRANQRVIPSRKRTTTLPPSTTARTATTTLSYLKRVAASRLRLAKLTGGKNLKATSAKQILSTTETPAENAADTTSRSTTTSTMTRDSVGNSWHRFKVNRNQRLPHHATRSTTVRPAATTPLIPHYPRTQHRFSNFKTQTSRGNRTRGAQTYAKTQAQSSTTTTTVTPTLNTEHPHIDLNYILNSFTKAPTFGAATTTATLQSSSFSLTTPPTAKPAANAVPDSVVNLSEFSDQLSSLDKLRRSIVDDSILQNFKTQPKLSSSQRYYNDGKYQTSNSGKGSGQYGKNLNAGTSSSTFTAIQRVETKSQLPQINIPGIVIARAEGQRIQPNSIDKVITSLVTEKPTTTAPTAAYVPLNDFLTNKFGYTVPAAPKTTSPTYFGQQTQQKAPVNYQGQQQTVAQVQATQIAKPQQAQQLLPFSAPQAKQQQQPAINYNQAQKNPFFAPVYPSSQYTQHHTRPQMAPPPQQQQLSYNQRVQNPFIQVSGNRQGPQVQQTQYRQFPQQQRANEYQQQQQQQQLQQQIQYNPQRMQQSIPYAPPAQAQQQYYQFPNPQQQQQMQFTQTQAVTQQVQAPPLQQQRELTNVFVNYQQQQRQLPQFPPLSAATANGQLSAPPTARAFNAYSTNNNNNNYLNVQLPAVPAGLIPAPNTQFAQRRSDPVPTNALAVAAPNVALALDNGVRTYVGASSYDVPISSIGRLPNDIAAALRRRLRRY